MEVAKNKPTIGDKITNICCPFGASSKELFYNLKYEGLVANYIANTIGILDLNGGEGPLNVEGSPIFSSNDKLTGIRLPNLHNQEYATSFSFFTPFSSLEQEAHPNPNLSFIAQIQTGNMVSSGVLISKEHGIVLTNSHCVESDYLDSMIN